MTQGAGGNIRPVRSLSFLQKLSMDDAGVATCHDGRYLMPHPEAKNNIYRSQDKDNENEANDATCAAMRRDGRHGDDGIIVYQ